MSQIETIQKIYQAFGTGNVPAILEHLAPDVEWEYGAAPNDIPWLQPRQGRENVIGFFESLAQVEMKQFHPKQLFENGPIVIALIDIEATYQPTGLTFKEEDEVHIWHFNTQGQVSRFRHGVDTLQHHKVFHG